MINIKDYLIHNKETIKQALSLDNTKWNNNITVNDILTEKKINVILERNKTYLVIQEGEPQFTMSICLQAIEKNCNIIFTLNDFYLAINSILIGIINKYLQDNKLKNFIKLYNNINDQKIFESADNVDKVLYIGDLYNLPYVAKHIHKDVIGIPTEESLEE